MKISDVLSAAAIIETAQKGHKIALIEPDTQETIYGTARHIVINKDTFGFAFHDDEVEKAFIRVTGTNGFEYCWSMPDAIRWHQAGNLFLDVTIPPYA